ncbi:MAG: thymidine phosphorylase, partial [Actinomycetospora chiangmaiensis]|nr:thymidine phosphorylase [Actinomycetospora chiangmaiensis]
MDVKQGSGAFMESLPAAQALAESIVTVAGGAGLRTAALITDMDAPLASAAGNAVEVAYAIDYLTGLRREPRFHAVTLALGAEMLVAGGLAADRAAAAERLERSLASGQAAERFARMVAALGGPADLLDKPGQHLPAAPVRRPVHRDGTVAGIATRALGLAVIELGGGRTRPEDRIDPRVGFTDLAGHGASDGLLGIVHAADAASAERGEAALRKAYRMGEAAAPRPAVIEAVGAR